MVRTGWFREIAVKSMDAQSLRLLLVARAQLRNIVDAQIAAGTFVPMKAAEAALADVFALDQLVENSVPHIKALLLDALRDRAKAYMPSLNAAQAAAERDVANGQTDFHDLSVDFSRLIRTPVATDEMPGTVRLPPIEMTLERLRARQQTSDSDMIRFASRINSERPCGRALVL